MNIPPAAIEAAAKAVTTGPDDLLAWDRLTVFTKQKKLRMVEYLLEAAMPYLREQIAKDIEALSNHYPKGPRSIYERAQQDSANIARGYTVGERHL